MMNNQLPTVICLLPECRSLPQQVSGRGIFTTVESALQIRPFMQNKPNFRKDQMNVNSLITKDYRKNDAFAVRKNKPKSNPIKPNTKPIKANKMPKQTQYKANQSQFAGCSNERKFYFNKGL
jgi:hypothetical protein